MKAQPRKIDPLLKVDRSEVKQVATRLFPIIQSSIDKFGSITTFCTLMHIIHDCFRRAGRKLKEFEEMELSVGRIMAKEKTALLDVSKAHALFEQELGNFHREQLDPLAIAFFLAVPVYQIIAPFIGEEDAQYYRDGIILHVNQTRELQAEKAA